MDYDRQDFAPCNTLHFRPDGALVGDVSFFSRDGECHLFYLSKRNDDPPRLPHNQLDHAVSTDLLHWELLPPALLPGEPGTADATGIGGCTIVPDRGIYHMFYAGTVNEVIYHARSTDLTRWHKDSPLRPLVVPDPRWYTPHTVPPEEGRAWRDPFLFRDPAGDRHWLLVTARLSEGAPTERGCVGLAVSEDLEHWEVKPPLYAPHICNAPEVCELFAMDGRYYLFFSHGETFTCRYRVAERWDGPYRRPPDDLLLPPWMYAPRSVCMDGNRYLIPWVADHLSGRDGYQPDYAPVRGAARGCAGSRRARSSCCTAGGTTGETWRWRRGTIRWRRSKASCSTSRSSCSQARRSAWRSRCTATGSPTTPASGDCPVWIGRSSWRLHRAPAALRCACSSTATRSRSSPTAAL